MGNQASILIVDDEEKFCHFLSKEFVRKGYAPHCAHTAAAALEALSTRRIDVVLLDIVLPRANGMDLLKDLRRDHPGTRVIMLTGNATVETAIESMKQGAYDYLIKPINIEELCLVVQRALEESRVRRENELLRWELGRQSRFFEFIGRHPAISKIKELVSKVAPTDSSVLIRGETGTGKELVARMIHAQSRRRESRFVAINCAAFQETLLESELFGHEKGSFTDAMERKSGLVEMAHDGTLFLDEIGNMTSGTQSKVLRILDGGGYRRVGGVEDLRNDSRIISATNQDLRKAIEDGRFREDLLYRIDVVTIQLPPLRERLEDIPLLVEHFLAKFHALEPHGRKTMSGAAMDLLTTYRWPGNVRELENVVERAIIMTEGPEIESTAIYLRGSSAGSSRPGSSASLADVEKAHILSVLAQTRGNKAKAAAILGVDVKTIYNKLKEYGTSS